MKYRLKDYMVSDIAKFYGLSGDTIRHYERKGILPSHKNEKDYRLFSRADFMLMDYILRLRKMEVPLDEILMLFNDCSFDETEKYFQKHQQTIREKIDELKETERLIGDHRRALGRLGSGLGKIQMKENVVLLTKEIEGTAQEAMDGFCGLKLGLMPVLTIRYGKDMITQEFVREIIDSETRADGEICLTALTDQEGGQQLQFSPEFELLSFRKTLYLADLVDLDSDYRGLERLFEYAENIGAAAAGDLFVRMISIEATPRPGVDYYEYWLPVK